jgi:hypothetical protein
MSRFVQVDRDTAYLLALSVQAMAHRLGTQEGPALYAVRKSTVEPVIGIITACRLRGTLERCPMHLHRPLTTPTPTGC